MGKRVAVLLFISLLCMAGIAFGKEASNPVTGTVPAAIAASKIDTGDTGRYTQTLNKIRR